MIKKLIIVIIAIVIISTIGGKVIWSNFKNTVNVDQIKDFVEEKIASFSEKGEEENTPASTDNDLPPSVAERTAIKLVACIDGDTILAEKDGENYKFRLIGVDTPESVATEEYLAKSGKQNTAEGKDASAFAKNLYETEIGGKGGTLYVVYDVQAHDTYGRELVYLYLPDGRMVQDILLENGMAQIMTIAPNVKNAEHFLEVQQKARENKAGFWADGFFA